jgi:hypothetical protein
MIYREQIINNNYNYFPGNINHEQKEKYMKYTIGSSYYTVNLLNTIFAGAEDNVIRVKVIFIIQ